MTKLGDHLELDFTNSSEQAPGAVNSSRASLVNFAMAALLIYLCNELPWVPGGIWPVVDIVSRPGTVVDARWPAGVAMSTSSSGQAIRICINACVARMLDTSEELSRLIMASCQSAGGGACTISGVDDHGRSFATMTTDDISGGGGARFASDGADSSGFTTSPGAAIANIEVNESYLPIRYLLRRRAGRLRRRRAAARWGRHRAADRTARDPSADQRAVLRAGSAAPLRHRGRRGGSRRAERIRHHVGATGPPLSSTRRLAAPRSCFRRRGCR